MMASKTTPGARSNAESSSPFVGEWNFVKRSSRATRFLSEYLSACAYPETTVNPHVFRQMLRNKISNRISANISDGRVKRLKLFFQKIGGFFVSLGFRFLRLFGVSSASRGQGNLQAGEETPSWPARTLVATKKKVEEIRAYHLLVIKSRAFSNFLLMIIFVNCLFISIEVSVPEAQAPGLYISELVFLGVYTAEFYLKITTGVRVYFADYYNIFDFVVLTLGILQLIIAFFPQMSANLGFIRTLRALRVLRSIRSVSGVRKLRVLVSALAQSLRKDAFNILAVLMVLLFLFAVMAYYLFGISSSNWNSLDTAFMTLMSFITNSSWSDVIYELLGQGYTWSVIFGLAALYLMSYVFPSMFIGLICQYIGEAESEDRLWFETQRAQRQRQKREAFQRRHDQDMNVLVKQKLANSTDDLQSIIAALAGRLRNDEVVPMTTLTCNITWLEAFMVTQYHLEQAMHRTQRTHFAIAKALTAAVKERELGSKQHAQLLDAAFLHGSAMPRDQRHPSSRATLKANNSHLLRANTHGSSRSTNPQN